MEANVKQLLIDSEYIVIVGLIREDIVKVSYPNGIMQFWGLASQDDEPYTVITDLAYGEEIISPNYAVPWALTTRIHLDCIAINYDPSYIIYVDEQGNEVTSMGDVLNMNDDDLPQYEALTQLLRTIEKTQSLDEVLVMAENEGVREGFEVCHTITTKDIV